MTREVIDALVPTHGRVSCTDENPTNSWNRRCLRCVLLSGVLPEGFHLALTIEAD